MSQKYRYDEETKSYVAIDEETTDDRRDERPPRPQRSATEDEKLIGILIWGAQFIIPLIASIVAYLYYEGKNEYLRNIGKEAINFNISSFIYGIIITIVGVITMGIGFVAAPLIAVYGIAIPIIGMLKASEMEVYIPHVTIRFLK